MTERLSGLPAGLLRTARLIREISSRDVREMVMFVWLANAYPWLIKDLGKNHRKYLARKGKLCQTCGAHLENWKEVFNEEHKCPESNTKDISQD